MTILALAAAWRISLANEGQFRLEQARREAHHLNHRTCCKIGLWIYSETILARQSCGTFNNYRQQLFNRLITLQHERSACSQKLMQLHSHLPLYWGKIIANARESRALRARHEDLSRQISALHGQGNFPQLTAAGGVAVIEPQLVVRANRSTVHQPFLETSMTRWLTLHPAEFESSSCQASLENLTYDQLRMLYAQLQVYRLDAQELIWRAVAARCEKIFFAMALMQVGLLITAPLSGGSFIASFYCHSFHVTKVLTVSSRLFGIATLAGAVGMRFAMRSYSKWAKREQEQSVALKKVTESMERTIDILTHKRRLEMVRWGFGKLQQHDRSLQGIKSSNAEISRAQEKITNDLKDLRASNERMDRQLEDLKRGTGEQCRRFEGQAGKLEDLKRENGKKGRQLEDQARKLEDLERENGKKGRQLEEQAERLARLEGLLLPQAS